MKRDISTIKYQTSHVKYQTSNITCQLSNIKYQIKYQLSNMKYQIYIKGPWGLSNISIYIYILYTICWRLGLSVQPGNRIRFVRACVRASGRARRGEAVWAWEALIRPRLGCGRSSCPPVCGMACGVACPRARWAGSDIGSFLVFIVWLSLLGPPGASSHLPWKRCKSLQIAADRQIDR